MSRRRKVFIHVKTLKDFFDAVDNEKVYELQHVTNVRPYPEHMEAFIDKGVDTEKQSLFFAVLPETLVCLLAPTESIPKAIQVKEAKLVF